MGKGYPGKFKSLHGAVELCITGHSCQTTNTVTSQQEGKSSWEKRSRRRKKEDKRAVAATGPGWSMCEVIGRELMIGGGAEKSRRGESKTLQS